MSLNTTFHFLSDKPVDLVLEQQLSCSVARCVVIHIDENDDMKCCGVDISKESRFKTTLQQKRQNN